MKNVNYPNKMIYLETYGWLDGLPTNAHSWIVPVIVKLLPKTSENIKILDIGCGNGYIASFLNRMGYDVIGVDISEDGILIAKTAYPGIRFEVASAYDDLLKIVSDVDVVIAIDLIEHLFSPKLMVENAYEVLRPKGKLIITTPYHGYLKNVAISILNKWDSHHTVNWEYGHIKFYSEKTLRELLGNIGFVNTTFHNVGRIRWLWKSMVCECFKPE